MLIDREKHPLGDMNRNGVPNAMEWVLKTLSDSDGQSWNFQPSAGGGLQLQFTHRQSSWAGLRFRFANSLGGAWHTLSFDDDQWETSVGASVEELDRVPNGPSATNYILDLQATHQADALFFYGELQFK